MPVWRDNARPNELLAFAFLQDNAQLEGVVDMATKTAKADGATKTTDMGSSVTSQWIFPTLVLWFKSCTVTCNGIK